jgi:hypothetical protein
VPYLRGFARRSRERETARVPQPRVPSATPVDAAGPAPRSWLAGRARAPRLALLAAAADRLLPFWFLLWSATRLYQISWNGFGWDLTFIAGDFHIYRNAGTALLNGGSPWDAMITWSGMEFHFAALPTAAQLFVPFALLPEGIASALFIGLSVGVALLALRRLGLPLWWLLFPPVMEGLYAGNPQILLFGLLIVGGSVGRAIASGLKVYALVPLLARREWRAIAATAVLFAVSFAISPGLWSSYLANFGAISARIVQQSHGGLSATMFLDPKIFGSALPADGIVRVLPGLIVYGLIGLFVLAAALRDVRSAGWVAVPLLWPAAEYHMATMAIPAARRLPIWLIAVPSPPTYMVGLVLIAYQVSVGGRGMAREGPAIGLVAWIRAFLPPPRRVSADVPLPPVIG